MQYDAYTWGREDLDQCHRIPHASWLNPAPGLMKLERWEEARTEFVALCHWGAQVQWAHTMTRSSFSDRLYRSLSKMGVR